MSFVNVEAPIHPPVECYGDPQGTQKARSWYRATRISVYSDAPMCPLVVMFQGHWHTSKSTDQRPGPVRWFASDDPALDRWKDWAAEIGAAVRSIPHPEGGRVMAHTVTEIEAPGHHYVGDGEYAPDDTWAASLPAGFDDEVDGHNCAVAQRCAGWNGHWGSSVGFALWTVKDAPIREYAGVRWWSAFCVDGTDYVVCEDCAGALEEGNLTVADGVWTWREDQ